MKLNLALEEPRSLCNSIRALLEGIVGYSHSFTALCNALRSQRGRIRAQLHSAVQRLKMKQIHSWRLLSSQLLTCVLQLARIHLRSTSSSFSRESWVRIKEDGEEEEELLELPLEAVDRPSPDQLVDVILEAIKRCETCISLQTSILRGWQRYSPALESIIVQEDGRTPGASAICFTWLMRHHKEPLHSVATFTSGIIFGTRKQVLAIEEIRACLYHQLEEAQRFRGFRIKVKDKESYQNIWHEVKGAAVGAVTSANGESQWIELL